LLANRNDSGALREYAGLGATADREPVPCPDA
jgi:hypothetical protein